MVSDSVLIALIVAAGPLALGVVNAFVSRRRHEENKSKAGELVLKINSRMDQILELTRQVAHAAGVKEEQERRGSQPPRQQ